MALTVIIPTGLEPPSLTVDTVMKFAVRGLEHASGPVREASTRIIFLAYKLAGISIKSYLPSDDPKTRKNPLYRLVLFIACARARVFVQRRVCVLKRIILHANVERCNQTIMSLGKDHLLYFISRHFQIYQCNHIQIFETVLNSTQLVQFFVGAFAVINSTAFNPQIAV